MSEKQLREEIERIQWEIESLQNLLKNKVAELAASHKKNKKGEI